VTVGAIDLERQIVVVTHGVVPSALEQKENIRDRLSSRPVRAKPYHSPLGFCPHWGLTKFYKFYLRDLFRARWSDRVHQEWIAGASQPARPDVRAAGANTQADGQKCRRGAGQRI
jgi:hypothetical protein